jgi:uncharacterized protein YjaZ
MIRNIPVKINMHFPDIQIANAGKKALVNEILSTIYRDKKTGYAGFLRKNGARGLYNRISGWISENSVKTYKQLTINDKKKIIKVIKSTIQKCLKFLPMPQFSVFVFPRVQIFNSYSEKMGRISGYTPRSFVIHIYIASRKFNIHSLNGTIAHEFNHSFFFNCHRSKSQTIREALIFEGLAENFKEQITKKKSIVSQTLTEDESKKAFNQIYSILDINVNWEDGSDYKNIFFGGGRFKRWTGYSVGYYIVKAFRKEYSDISWEALMKIAPRIIFNKSSFVKNQMKKQKINEKRDITN